MNRIVSQDEWMAARMALLAKEKEFTRLHDQLSAERLALPWTKVEKNYVFDSPSGPVTLADLFRGRSQLFVKHFMLAPGQKHFCVGCSLESDHYSGIVVHLENHDVAFAAIARAPIDEIEAFRKRMGWSFTFVSSNHNSFNDDFHVSFTPEARAAGKAYYNYSHDDPGNDDRSGHSAFVKDDAGQVFHTYSRYGRGVEAIMGIYGILDMMPKGRNEDPRRGLTDWVRLHDVYGKGGTVTANGRYHPDDCHSAEHV